MTENQNIKTTIRRSIRLERANLSINEKAEKAHALMGIIVQLPEFIHSQHLGAYWPNDSEINPLGILATAHKMGKSCYLPRLDPAPMIELQFVEYQPEDYLTANRLGILEPSLDDRKSIAPKSLDLVLVPLVAFDEKGQRLGMGKGYYDRTFAFHKIDPNSKPFLLGIAYDLQKISELPSEAWDIPLDGVATETQFVNFKDLV
ncbi:MAG TPA: 5-formyltetrahydrofolate cyclo-ligase [Gammaproteobacteria bacterium]|nr:5-formyltetrahydrofolate cyclo-ligase [Gammaproteobacteria bacterium]